MKVLVAGEFSGITRDAFIALGHDAISCDFLPTERPGPHIQGDFFPVMYSGDYDLMIAHPTCTFLTNAGARHLWSVPSVRGKLPHIHGPTRWAAMVDAAADFRKILAAPISKICVENPIPHGWAVKVIGQKYTQLVQPWQFGHGETKATCLWLKGLPNLTPTNVVAGREPRIFTMGPSPDRGKARSVSFEGIAAAMAEQWGRAIA